MIDNILVRYLRFAPLILRLGIGVVLGTLVLQNISGGGMALGEAAVALAGAALLLAGFFTNIGAVISGALTLVLLLMLVVRYPLDPNAYRDLGIVGASAALLFLGAGPFSIDGKREFKKTGSRTELALRTEAEPASRLLQYAPLFIRLGLAVIFLMFGVQKLSVPGQTTGEIQLLFGLEGLKGLSVASLVNYYTGILELSVGLGLLLGFWVRKAALLGAFMVGGIFLSFVTFGQANDPNLFRDIGLSAAAFSLALMGSGAFSLDRALAKRKGHPLPHLALVREDQLAAETKAKEASDAKGKVAVDEKGEYKLPPSKLNIPQ